MLSEICRSQSGLGLRESILKCESDMFIKNSVVFSSNRSFEQGMFADIYFVVHGETIPAHRAILAARSAYLAEMLQTKWSEKMVFFPRTAEVGVFMYEVCRTHKDLALYCLC